MIAIKANLAMPINIGHQGENDARCVQFDLSEFQTEFPSGIPLLIVQRPNDTTIYPIALEIDGTTAIWTVTATETEYTGLGKCVLQWSVDDVIVKSCMYITMVAPSLTLGAGTMPDEPGKSWYEHILSEIGNLDNLTTKSKDNLVNAINEAAKTGSGTSGGGTVEMRVSDGYIQYGDGTTWNNLIALSELKGTDGHSPEVTATKVDKTTTISVDGTAVAEIKDGENGTDGDDGFSPAASVSKTGTVTTVKITDKSGTTTAEVKDGEPGTNGTSVSISKISESAEDGGENVVTFNDGKTLSVKNGNKGSDGFSPSVTVSKSGTETTVTATDKSGTTSAVVKDGEDGYSPSAKVTKTDNGVKISITDKDGTTEQEVDTSGGTAEVTKQSVIDALGYTPAAIGNPEDWALVQTVTVTDATVKQYVLSFSDIMEHIIIMGSQPSDQTSNLGVTASVVTDVDGVSVGLPYLSYMIDLPTYTKPAYTHIWCENGMVNAQHMRFAQNGNSISTHWDWCDKEHLDTRIRGFKSCSCYRGGGFPVGTIINVYGKKLSDVSTDAASGDMLSTDYDADGAVKTAGGIAKYVAENAGSGSGDMKQSDYDADGAVKSAGGIVKYAASMVGVANGIAPLNASKKVPVANLPTSDSTSSSSSTTVATSKAVKEAYDLAKAAGSGISVSGATAGQTVKISAVDDSGVPTAWEAVDLASGEEWTLITRITVSEDSLTQLNITTDADGNAFSYRELYCVCQYPHQQGTDLNEVYFGPNGKTNSNISYQPANNYPSQAAIFWAQGLIVNGMSGNSGSAQTRMAAYYEDTIDINTPLTSALLRAETWTSGHYLCNGMKVSLWGRGKTT